MATDEKDKLLAEYNAEKIAIENENITQEILLQRQKLTDALKKNNERLKKELKEVRNQVRMEETDSLSSQTKLKFISSLQDQDFKGSQFPSMSWNSIETIRSHSENSDYYIDVKSCNNRSHQLSSTSDIYESVGSASCANIRPGKYIQQATKRRYCCIYKVLFAFLCAFLLLTTLTALGWQLFGSDDSATTQIESSCTPCNMSEVKGENNKTCCGRNFTESLIESDGAGASKKTGRQTRTASSNTPNFYLHGSGSSRATDVYGNFIWKRPEHRTFSREDDCFSATINPKNSLTKVTILRGGVYYVFAKVTANGKSPLKNFAIPAVSIYLKKNDDVLDIAWTTQDNRGGIYNALRGYYNSDEIKYPMDSLSVSGLHRLEANDEIYVQRPPDSIFSGLDAMNIRRY
ncbi:uncharacterized protein LOC128558690 isoform X2 [Mercenaria mercenaria]|uniref:uncharacterized protein LOC128558690 isoform X2 n=1 Tax=Mercenaria mercenaria TaxID=6596 RepID=UPI00234EB852|nr:uncharacterized protein LOC128558690 isoform X2 [Mercenaria mercenaria]